MQRKSSRTLQEFLEEYNEVRIELYTMAESNGNNSNKHKPSPLSMLSGYQRLQVMESELNVPHTEGNLPLAVSIKACTLV